MTGALKLTGLVMMVSGLIAMAGCASTPTTGTTPGSTLLHPQYTVALDAPTDQRDFSRIDVVRPELRAIFEPARDVYILDGPRNPHNMEFVSGTVFRWDMPAADVVQEAVRRELERSDWISSVRTTAGAAPDFMMRVKVLEFHYFHSGSTFIPQVGLELQVVDMMTRQVLERIPARVTNEYTVSGSAKEKQLMTLVVEDWLERDLRDQMNRALEWTAEKGVERLEEYLEGASRTVPGTGATGGG